MDIQSTSFSGKSQPLKSKPSKKTLQAPRESAKESAVQSKRRVFGVTRNPNIPNDVLKTKQDLPRKPLTKKPSIQVSLKQPELTQSTLPENKYQEKNKATVNKKRKSVGFEESTGKNNFGVLTDGDGIGTRTPQMDSTFLVDPKRASGTPYQSAERCSNCRFDRLETTAYWLSQIKLAESVGKHFVSAAFFRLALESKAEPFRSLRVELKGYVARHEYLSKEVEWRDVFVSYGLIQTEADANSGSNTPGEAQKDMKKEEQAMEPLET